MELTGLRDELMEALASMYEQEACGALTEFLQGELRVLFYLSLHRQREVYPSLLSEKLHVSRPRITAALAALRAKGYVSTRVSEKDRRRMQVQITESGAAYLRSKQEKVEEYFNRLVEGLGEENVRDLIRLIHLSNQIISREE
jgi:DNA-binding MarR family transcriptional regulator